MGGAVSSGRDNNELVDNLMSGNYIRTRAVERVFRALDRADYMTPEARDQAYKDLAWRNGPLHLSAPCIYSEVMEALELKPGLSFLNIGSGTGYLSTLVGLIIGSSGISHGIEASSAVYEYANKKLSQFIENSATIDEFDFCTPKYYTGNGLCLSPSHSYDRVYCGAGVVAKYESYFKQFIKVGGVLVMPLADQLVQLRRVSATHWSRRSLLNVSFANLFEPAARDPDQLITLDEQCPPALQALSRGAVRAALRAGVMRRDGTLREPPPRPPQHPRQGPRRICIPYDDTSDEELGSLHDLDEAGGAHEMNALLSLVLSMGQNRAAGSLRFEHQEEPRPERAQEAGEEREREEAPPPAEDDFIVFDVGFRAAMRRRARAPRPPPAAGDASAAGEDAPATDDPPAESSSSGEAGEAARPRAPPRRADRPRSFWSDLSSSEDDAAQVKDNKRQKLDSGIGEGTASSGGSPQGSEEAAARSRSSAAGEDEDGDTDMPWVERGSESASSGAGTDSDGGGSGSGDGDEGGDEGRGGGGGGARAKRTHQQRCSKILTAGGGRRRGVRARSGRRSESEERAGARRDAGGARRVRLSLAMKRAVKELPLPHALKKYLNYGRCYQI